LRHWVSLSFRARVGGYNSGSTPYSVGNLQKDFAFHGNEGSDRVEGAPEFRLRSHLGIGTGGAFGQGGYRA